MVRSRRWLAVGAAFAALAALGALAASIDWPRPFAIDDNMAADASLAAPASAPPAIAPANDPPPSGGPHTVREDATPTTGAPDTPPGGLVVVGRARRSDGQPLARRSFLLTDRSSCCTDLCDSDDDGRFVFAFAGEADAPRHLAGGCLLESWTRGDLAAVNLRGAMIPLPDAMQPGLVDLGDVTLTDASCVLRGGVRGNGALRELSIRATSGRVAIRTLDEGRFEVWGLPHHGEATLEVVAAGHAERRMRISLPGPYLDIALDPETRCRIEATLDPGLEDGKRTLRVDLVDSAGRRFRGTSGWSPALAWQCTMRVPPGTYRCEMRAFANPTPILTVPHVEVDAGLEPHVNFDLRGRLRIARFVWVDRNDEPMRLDGARMLANGGTEVLDGESRMDGLEVEERGYALLGTAGNLDLVVKSPSFEGHYRGPFANARVVLDRPASIPFYVPDLPAAPSGRRWRIEAIGVEGDASWRTRSVRDVVGSDGLGALPLLANSSYRVELYLEGDDIGPFAPAVDTCSLETGSSLLPVFTFRFDAQKLRDAVR